MGSISRAYLAQLLQEREQRQGSNKVIAFDPLPLLYPKQQQRVTDPHRFAAWPAGRQAGKTTAACCLLLSTALSKPHTQALYVTTSIKRAAATVWAELCRMNREQHLGGLPNETLHQLKFPNGSLVQATGCENKVMADDLRGRFKVALYFIDEAQDWKDELLTYFYHSVVYPSLVAVQGRVILAGTGASPRGFWYEAASSSLAFHRFDPWLTTDNVTLPPGEAEALIDAACTNRGVDRTDPSIRKEFFAEFVSDLNRQIFPFNAELNFFEPASLPPGPWSYGIGSDFGTVDAAAVVVWGWTPHSPSLYVLETEKQHALGSSAQVELVRSIMARYQHGLAFAVGDPGGGGKGLIQDLRQEHWLPMEAAEKQGKASACVLMRDGLRSGRIKVSQGEQEFIQELQQPEWDPDAIGSVVRGHMPDRVDAALYGYRQATKLHHFETAATALTPLEQEYERVQRQDQAEQDFMRDMGLA